MTSAGDSVVVRLPERFEQFYEREYHRVVGFAYALAGSWEAAEDATQEAFLRAHRQWARVGRHDQPGAWVRRVAANLAVSAFRRRLAEARALVRLAGRRTPTHPWRARRWTSGGPSGPCPAASARPWPCSTWRTGSRPRSPGSSAAPRSPSPGGSGWPWPPVALGNTTGGVAADGDTIWATESPFGRLLRIDPGF